MRFTIAAALVALTSFASASPLEPGLNDLATRQAPKGGPRAQRADQAASLKEKSWNPPASMAKALDDTWAWVVQRRPQDLKRKGWIPSQINDNDGKLYFCVRWHSESGVADAATRATILKGLQVQTQKWADLLIGYDGWPYTKVPVKIVGWAGFRREQFPGLNETSEGKFYNKVGEQGGPECPRECGHFFNMGREYPKCPGGKEAHYDMSLWLSDNLGGGAGGVGGDWGQRIYRTATISQFKTNADATIFLHEMGHGYGIDDFYTYTPQGQTNFIMKAGSSPFITEFDAWMVRDWYRHLKSNGVIQLPGGGMSKGVKGPRGAAPPA